MIYNDKDYKLFRPYVKPKVADWGHKTSDEVLVEDAPKEAKEAFGRFVKREEECRKRGIIS